MGRVLSAALATLPQPRPQRTLAACQSRSSEQSLAAQAPMHPSTLPPLSPSPPSSSGPRVFLPAARPRSRPAASHGTLPACPPRSGSAASPTAAQQAQQTQQAQQGRGAALPLLFKRKWQRSLSQGPCQWPANGPFIPAGMGFRRECSQAGGGAMQRLSLRLRGH